VDRDDAMQHAVNLIRGGEAVVVIEGERGVGKSAVAYELAHRLHLGDYDDDVAGRTFLWVDAGNGCPRLVDICESLSLLTGNQRLSMAAEERKIDALRAHLATNKTVLLLDNMQLGDDPEAASVRKLLRTIPTGTLVIASANCRGELDAAPVALDDLELADVRELIQQTARRLGLEDAARFDEEFARRLRQALGGNPARIEWFLRALRGTARSVEDCLAAVEQGEGLAEMYAPVWEELTDEDQSVLAACAYLRGDAILEQLVVACGRDEEAVLGHLDELVRLGLVVTVRVTGRPDVFGCPHGVQRFVRLRTPQRTTAEFTRRLADHYIAYFGVNWEDAHAAIPHVGAIQAVMEELFAQEDHPDLQALYGATYDLFFSLGLFDARIATGRLAFTSAERAGNDRCASLASEVLSSTHAIRGELDEAREALAHGLLAAERSGAPGELARQKRCAGWVQLRSGQPALALAAIEGADELAREDRDFRTLVNLLNLRSYVYWHVGDVERSEAAAKASLRVCEEIRWERAKAFPIRQFAEAATQRGEFGVAREQLSRARAIAVQTEDKRHLARLQVAEARLGLVSGDLALARKAATQAEADAAGLGLAPEAREARALRRAAGRARLLPPLRLYYARRRPTRLTDAPLV
jgi:hypothetical protein